MRYLGLVLCFLSACSSPPAVDVGADALDESILDAHFGDVGPVDAAVQDAPATMDTPALDDAGNACETDDAAIAALTLGLFYTSEGDEPLMVRSFPGEGSAAPTADDVLRLSLAGTGSTTETRTVEQFFANVVIDPTAIPAIDPTQPEMLRAAVEASWRDLSFVRVIDPAEAVRVRVFLVGRNQCGALVWLRSISIET